MQIFCFTYAGGNASFYDQLESFLSPKIKIIKLEYAGHGNRRKEPFYSDFSELVKDLYEQVKGIYQWGEPYALIGYSMGSIAVIEILKEIMLKEEMAIPTHVFLAAHEPYSKTELINYNDSELDNFIKEQTVYLGGIPDKLIENKSFWRVYLPIYRADYLLISKYHFEQLTLKTDIPLTVFYSEEDTPYCYMEKWTEYFIGETTFVEYNGRHFFLQQHCEEISEIINERLSI